MSLSGNKGKIAISSVMIVAMAIALVIPVPSGPAAGGDSFKPHKLTILFTGDDWGQVKPCG